MYPHAYGIDHLNVGGSWVQKRNITKEISHDWIILSLIYDSYDNFMISYDSNKIIWYELISAIVHPTVK